MAQRRQSLCLVKHRGDDAAQVDKACVSKWLVYHLHMVGSVPKMYVLKCWFSHLVPAVSPNSAHRLDARRRRGLMTPLHMVPRISISLNSLLNLLHIVVENWTSRNPNPPGLPQPS